MELELPDRYVDPSLLTSQENRRVLRCRDAETDRWVALKCLLPPLDDSQAELFRTEYLRLEAMDHPNWVRPGRFFSLPSGGYGFDLELSSGVPLLAGPFRGWCPEVAEVSRQILSGLHALHLLGAAHLDLKPDQILVGWDRIEDPGMDPGVGTPESAQERPGTSGLEDRIHVHLLDLGLSHPFGSAIGPTGTAGYMAPEILRGEPGWDCRVDLYAFGAILFELIWGRPPFAGSTAGETVRSQLRGVDLSDQLRGREVPAPVVRLVSELLDVDPESRPRSAFEVFERLTRAAAARGWDGLRSDLAEARAFPFVGRENETETFERWWRGVALTEQSARNRCSFSIEAEPYLGADRLRDRLLALAQILGGRRETATSVATPGGTVVSIEVKQTPASMDLRPTEIQPGGQPAAGSEVNSFVLRLGTDSREALSLMAQARGLVSPLLIDYLVRLSWGRKELLWDLVESVPERVRRHRWREGIEFDRCLSRIPPPSLAVEWLGRAFPSLPEADRIAWVSDALVRLSRDDRWCYPKPLLTHVEHELRPDLQTARWVLEAAGAGEVEAAVERTLAGTEDRIADALVRTIGRQRRNPALAPALERLSEGGYFETFVRLFLESIRSTEFADLLAVLPSLLRVFVITGRVQFPPNSVPLERVRALDGEIDAGAILECMFLLGEGQAPEAATALSEQPPAAYPASEVWWNLRRYLGLEDDSAERAPGPGPEDPEVDLWRKARSLHSAEPETVVRFLEDLRSPDRDPGRTWRIAMWAGTDANAKNELDIAARTMNWVVEADRRWSRGSIAASAYMNLAGIDYERGQLAAARRLLSAVVDESRLLGIRALFSAATINLCAVTAEMGLLKETLELAESARREGGDRSGYLLSWLRSGWTADVAAETDGMLDDLEDPEYAMCAQYRGIAQLLLSDPAGRVLLARVSDAARRSHAAGDLVDVLTGWLLAELDVGSLPTGIRDELSALVPRAEGISQVRAALAVAQFDIQSGRGGDALMDDLDEIDRRIEEYSLFYYGWRTSWLRSELLGRQGSPDRAARSLLRMRDQLTEIVVPMADARHERRFLALPGCQRALQLLETA